MTDQPYTQADLIAEAARQHYSLTDDADYGCVGESMEDEGIGDTSDIWGSLPESDYEAAQDAIHGLIIHAADLSAWAVAAGADGLEPSPNVITLVDEDRPGGRPLVRVHLAFAPDLPDENRERVMRALGDALHT